MEQGSEERDAQGAIRLLMVTPRFHPESGGVETHVYEVGRRLVSMGVSVAVLCTDTTGKLPKRGEVAGMSVLRVRALPPRLDYRLAPGLGRVVRSGSWDVIHVQSYHTMVAPHAMLAALRTGTPYVLSFHAGGHSGRLRTAARPAQQRLLRPLLVRAARLVVMARFEIEHYGRVLRLPPERFVAVPNGSDLPELLPGERHPPDPGLIASVGRLERFKGHHRAIAALPEVARRRPDVRLWIAGSGPYGPKLRRLAARLGVSDRVEIEAVPPDRRREMAERLSRASLVVLLSEFETHPIAVLEAAALGRPVLVGDTSGLRELAQDGLARAIPLDASPERLAGAMIEEMQRPPLVRSPAIHTWDECAERLLGVYREVLGRAA